MNGPALLDLAKTRKVMTDADLAQHIGVSRARIADWRRGKRIPDHHVVALARLADLEPVEVLPATYAEREDNEEVKGIWEEIRRRVALGAIILGVCTTTALPSEANGAEMGPDFHGKFLIWINRGTVYYVK